MMNTPVRPLAAAILKSGVLSDEMLLEFKKWGYPFEEDANRPIFNSAEDVIACLESALYDQGLVVERVTDFDLVSAYARTAQFGVLHVELSNGDETAASDFPVAYGRTALGEYILPWKGDNVQDELLNGLTHLRTVEGEKIFFCGLREFYFDDRKVFMVCEAAEKKSNGS